MLQFLHEQFSLLYAVQKRYSPASLLVAFRLFCVSRAAYKLICDTCLTLPHVSYLHQLTSCFAQIKEKLSCIDCRLELFTEKALECDMPHGDDFSYMADIDRGGLTWWPTDLLLHIVVQCVIVFKCVVSKQHATQFNLAHNQRAITAALALQRCVTVLEGGVIA